MTEEFLFQELKHGFDEMFFPLGAALATAISQTLTKVGVSKEKIHGTYVATLTPWIMLVICLIISPFLINLNEFSQVVNYWPLFLIVGIIAAAYNLLFYKGLELESVAELQPFFLFSHIFTVSLAVLIFPSERSLPIFIAVVISSIALILSHVEHKHLFVSKGAALILLNAFMFAVEAQFIKVLLENFSPLTIFIVRILIMGVILLLIFRPKISFKQDKKNLTLVLLSVFFIIQYLFTFTGYAKFGISYTTLILTTYPLFVFAIDYLFLKEKIRKKIVLAAVIIAVIIALVQII